MLTLKAIAIIFTTFSVLGIAVDQLLLHKYKKSLHDSMTAWWAMLDDAKIPDIPRIMANWLLIAIEKILQWQTGSCKSILFCVLLSCILTSTFAIIGVFLEVGTHYETPIPLPIFSVYLVNFPFDVITIFVTFIVLKVIISKGQLIGAMFIAIDIFVAFILALLCYSTIAITDQISFEYNFPGSFYGNKAKQNRYLAILGNKPSKDGFSGEAMVKYHTALNFFDYLKISPIVTKNYIQGDYFSLQKWVIVEVKEGNNKKIYRVKDRLFIGWQIIVSWTTFVPTLIYMSILFTMFFGKILLNIFRSISMYVLEAATQCDPKNNPKDFVPGTFFGVLFGGIAALIKAIIDLFNLF